MAGAPADPRFTDGKDAGALRTIGEVASALGIRQHVLRYWEQQFPMLRPLKRSGGRRYYRPADVALLETIERLVNREGYTLKGAKLALQGGLAPAAARSPAPANPVAGVPGEVIAQIKAIRAQLATALDL
jgi:DNA-binding transcriptional MerR regulator